VSDAPFSKSADWYDAIYAGKAYSAEVNWVADQLDAQPGTLLDLGCGTGRHAAALAELGWTVTGVDLSDAMVARAVSENLTPSNRFLAHDLRTLRLEERFDVVLSLFHVASYMCAPGALDEFFATAAAHLSPGGILAFDYWHGPAVLSLGPSVRAARFEDSGHTLTRLAEPDMDVLRDRVVVNYTFMVDGGLTATFTEQHRMRYLFVRDLERRARACGFEARRHIQWMGSEAPTQANWAAFSVFDYNGSAP
jgi:predicted TPR repeat methyltransferase